MAILSTTISIILTFGTAWLLDLNKQRKERRLTALMVLSSIESFSRGLDTVSETWDWQDSIATWLLSIPVEEIEELGNEPFEDAIYEIVRGLPLLKHDKTAENIFSNNIDTWKNMENFLCLRVAPLITWRIYAHVFRAIFLTFRFATQ